MLLFSSPVYVIQKYIFFFSFPPSFAPHGRKAFFLYFSLAILFYSYFWWRYAAWLGLCKDGTLWASHLATFIKLTWFMWNGGWRGEDTLLHVRAPACVRELCRCRLPFPLGNRAREVERVSSQVHTTRTVKSIWRFLLLLQAGLTYIKEAIPMLISFLPLPSKHLHQYTSTIIPDIFGSLRICLSANISQQIYQKITYTQLSPIFTSLSS